MIRQLIGLLVVNALAGLACAQPAPAPTTQMLGASVPVVVTRADLAEAYLRLERALHEHPPAQSNVARVSRAYDRAAFYFFTGKHAEAIRAMNELADSLVPAEKRTDAQRVIDAIKVRIAPAVAMSGRPSALHIKFSPLYPVELEAPLSLRLVIRSSDDKIVLEQPVNLRADAALPTLTLKQPQAPVGSYRVQLVANDGQTFDMTRWFVTDTPLDVRQIVNERDLLRIDGADPAIFQALVAARARNGLLTDKPGETESAKFRVDLIALARELRDEIAVLAQGRDPYINRPGDYWRAIPANQMQIPARVYAPAEALANQKSLPLVIALHGAGGDENAFMDGYGFGEIKRLADRHGFLVVAPSTYWCSSNPAAFDGIVESLACDYPIDRSRIYLLGHSLGAMAAANIAAKHPDEIAAACLLAGGNFNGAAKLPPTRLVAAALDRVIPSEKLEAGARAAQAARLPVEYELMNDYGHVYMADAALGRAIEWLLSHAKGATTAPAK